MSNALQTTKDRDSLLSKDNIEHSLRIADLLAKTDMTPKAYKNKPNDVLIAMELGRSWGLSPLQAIQNIAVINGKPCAYGDLVLAICSSHPDFENIEEQKIAGKDGKVIGYKCTVKRKGRTEVSQSFTLEQASKAGLMERSPTWKAYPERMLQMRARGFALRDSFADALNGVAIREEVEDYEVKDITPKQKETKSDALMNKLKAAKGQVIDAEPNPSEETGEIAAPEQMKQLHALIAAKGFNNGRLTKAMEHYGVETLGQLTSAQADDFIKQMNKLEDKA